MKLGGGGRRIPRDLVLGVATSAHQVEGGDELTDWWAFELERGRIASNESSGRAADFWNRYAEDARLMARYQVEAHRMSVSWARVEPREGYYCPEALAHYAAVVDAHHAAGVKVAVTLLHFALPRWLAARGGMLASDAVARFGAFAREVATALRGRIWQWHTVNEPFISAVFGYLLARWPPAVRAPLKLLRFVRAQLCAHVAAYRAVAAVDDAPIGLVHNFVAFGARRPESKADRALAAAADWAANGVLLEALATGRLRPPLGRGEKLDGLAQTSDLVGVNYYNAVDIGIGGWRHRSDGGSHGRVTAMGWRACASALVPTLHAAGRLGAPVYVTENGIATDDDAWRQEYLVQHVAAACQARAEGVDVRGYFHWSWIDNFEWAAGFRPKFGIVARDPATNERRPKQSAALFARLSSERVLEPLPRE